MDNDDKQKRTQDARDTRNPTQRVDDAAPMSGFQVLRKEFTIHKFDAAISFACDSITFNAACLRFYEDTNYVQILIDEKNQRIAIRKCGEYDRDAMQWARYQRKDGKRVSRPIKAAVATARLFEMKGWDTNKRYKILGTRKIYQDADIVLFLMNEAEGYETEKVVTSDGKVVRRNHSFLPYQWRDS